MSDSLTLTSLSQRSYSDRMQSSTKKKTSHLIVIISKQEDTRILFKTFFGFWGYETAELEKTEDFSKTFQREKPDLVILDMPQGYTQGLADFCNLRKSIKSQRIPIIMLSGYSQPVYRQAALKLGADDFLVKPIDFDNLEEILENYFSCQNKTLLRSDDLKLNLPPHQNFIAEGESEKKRTRGKNGR